MIPSQQSGRQFGSSRSLDKKKMKKNRRNWREKEQKGMRQRGIKRKKRKEKRRDKEKESQAKPNIRTERGRHPNRLHISTLGQKGA